MLINYVIMNYTDTLQNWFSCHTFIWLTVFHSVLSIHKLSRSGINTPRPCRSGYSLWLSGQGTGLVTLMAEVPILPTANWEYLFPVITSDESLSISLYDPSRGCGQEAYPGKRPKGHCTGKSGNKCRGWPRPSEQPHERAHHTSEVEERGIWLAVTVNKYHRIPWAACPTYLHSEPCSCSVDRLHESILCHTLTLQSIVFCIFKEQIWVLPKIACNIDC